MISGFHSSLMLMPLEG